MPEAASWRETRAGSPCRFVLTFPAIDDKLSKLVEIEIQLHIQKYQGNNDFFLFPLF
jgi:hypothetical protein